MKCLWISRDIPFPLDAGDKIYSALMAKSLSDAGVALRFLGFGSALQSPKDRPADWLVETRPVTGAKFSNAQCLFKRLPIAAAIHATPAYHALLDAQLREPWDMIVLDSYGSGWALDACLRLRERLGARAPVVVYLSHNHEESIWRAMAFESQAGIFKRLALWQNYLKVRSLERRLAVSVDLISAITAEDAESYRLQTGGASGQASTPSLALTPGYSGAHTPSRQITEQTPRRVVLVGSFRWVVKQENLRRFLKLADARFKAHGIQFDVIGDVPQNLLDELKPTLQATQLHGFVDDIASHLAAARMAVVPEVIGGGFKLKYLDYLFNRVPIATISEAAAGLPTAIRENMLCREDLPQLVDAIIEHIDQTETLNLLQDEAFSAAGALFNWADRGVQLKHAVRVLRIDGGPANAPSATPRATPQTESAR